MRAWRSKPSGLREKRDKGDKLARALFWLPWLLSVFFAASSLYFMHTCLGAHSSRPESPRSSHGAVTARAVDEWRESRRPAPDHKPAAPPAIPVAFKAELLVNGTALEQIGLRPAKPANKPGKQSPPKVYAMPPIESRYGQSVWTQTAAQDKKQGQSDFQWFCREEDEGMDETDPILSLANKTAFITSKFSTYENMDISGSTDIGMVMAKDINKCAEICFCREHLLQNLRERWKQDHTHSMEYDDFYLGLQGHPEDICLGFAFVRAKQECWLKNSNWPNLVKEDRGGRSVYGFKLQSPEVASGLLNSMGKILLPT